MLQNVKKILNGEIFYLFLFLFMCIRKKAIFIMNPFAINQNIHHAMFSGGTSPYIGGGQTGGVQGTSGAQGPYGGGKTWSSYQSDINEVAMIGASKRAGFENGLGGTNNPDDHKLFMAV